MPDFDLSKVTEADEYCPVCQKTIHPSNMKEVYSGEHDGFIYVHDEIPHTDSDMQALGVKLQ